MKNYKHYLLTRFNLGLFSENKYEIKDPSKWMDRRIEEFKKWNLPSVLNQSEKSFKWVILIDENTPKRYINQLNELLHPYDVWTVKSIDAFSEMLMHTEKEFIITTRLDNDDIIHPDFIAEIQKAHSNKVKLIDVDGEQWDAQTNKYYTSGRDQNNSPFLSLIERTSKDIKTCYEYDHTYMPFYYHSQKIDKVLYTQVLHGNNIANKIKGVEK